MDQHIVLEMYPKDLILGLPIYYNVGELSNHLTPNYSLGLNVSQSVDDPPS